LVHHSAERFDQAGDGTGASGGVLTIRHNDGTGGDGMENSGNRRAVQNAMVEVLLVSAGYYRITRGSGID